MSRERTRVLLAGVGRHGAKTWGHEVLPKLQEQGLVECVGIMDLSEENLSRANEELGLPSEKLYRNLDDAIRRSGAETLIDATPMQVREKVSGAAMDAGLPVFMEKPVCMDMEACCRLYAKARSNGLKAAVNMTNHHFQDKQSFLRYLRDGRCGKLDYLFTRFSWRMDTRRNPQPHNQILEGSVHALSYLREMAGGNAKRVFNHSWNPDWSPLPAGSSANVFIEMENGVRAQLESSWSVKATINGWGREYLRADCEKGALELDRRELRFWQERKTHQPEAETLPWIEGDAWGHELLFREFVRWIRGEREDHFTDFEDNLQVMAILFAAIESAERGGEGVEVQPFLQRALVKAGVEGVH